MPSHFPAILDSSLSESARLGVQNIFAFCYVWSVGGALSSQSREAFDAFVRNSFQGVANFPTGAGLVYDYYCDPSRSGLAVCHMLCASAYVTRFAP